jgi:ATP-dependent helicase/DNAse subunit B
LSFYYKSDKVLQIVSWQVKSLGNKIKISYSNSPFTLFNTFKGDLKGFIQKGGDTDSGDYIVITPNAKSSMEIISSLLKEPGFDNSFLQGNFATINTICRNITKELNLKKIIINETCCKEILKEIVAEHSETLTFKSIKDCSGLYDDLYRLIIKFKENSFSPKGHDPFSDKAPPAGGNACNSFLHVYQKYNEYLSEKGFFDEADEIIFAKKNAASSRFLSKIKKIFVIGFVNFSGFEESLLAGLSKIVKHSNIYMPYDDDEKRRPLYSHLKSLFSRFEKFNESELIFLDNEPQKTKSNLDYLKNNVFISYKKKEDVSSNDKSVNIINASGIEDEAGFLAYKIKSLIKKDGYSPDEIAVIIRNNNDYSGKVSAAFEKCGIAANLKKPYNILELNIIKTAMLPLYLVQRDFLRDDVKSFLGSGYIDTGSDIDIGRAEMTLIQAGIIKGAQSYAKRLKKLEETLRSESRAASGFTAKVRDFIHKFIEFLTRRIKRFDTVSNYKKSLAAVLEETYRIKERMVKKISAVPPELIRRDIMAYAEFLKVFDDITAAFEFSGKTDKKINITQLIDILTAELMKSSVKIDESVDYAHENSAFNGEVQFFTPEEFFLKPYKAVFILNMTDGVFPKKPRPSFLLGGEESRFSFLPKIEDVFCSEKIFFFRILSLCSEELYITYPDDSSGLLSNGASSGGRSPFIDDVSILIEGSSEERTIERHSAEILNERDRSAYCKEDFLIDFFSNITVEAADTGKDTFDFLVNKSGENGHFKRILNNVLIEYDRENSKEFTCYEGNIAKAPDFLKVKLLEKMECRTFSVSQLDTFANCPISYFFSKILYLTPIELPKPGLLAKDRGAILHDILFTYFSSAKETLLNLVKNITPSQLDELIAIESERIEKTAQTYLDENTGMYPFTNPHIMEIEKTGITNTLKNLVEYEIKKRHEAIEKLEKAEENYRDALRRSEKLRLKGTSPKYLIIAEQKYSKAKNSPFLFEPAYFEHGFGSLKKKAAEHNPVNDQHADFEAVRIDLSPDPNSDDGRILIRGYIDRIDVNEEAGEFIVIDYKSGSSPAIKAVREGRNFQLPIYEECVQRTLLKEYKPACGAYYSLNKPKYTPIPVLFEHVRPFLLKYIKTMKAGEFFVLPNKYCRSYCEFPSICRYDDNVSE